MHSTFNSRTLQQTSCARLLRSNLRIGRFSTRRWILLGFVVLSRRFYSLSASVYYLPITKRLTLICLASVTVHWPARYSSNHDKSCSCPQENHPWRLITIRTSLIEIYHDLSLYGIESSLWYQIPSWNSHLWSFLN